MEEIENMIRPLLRNHYKECLKLNKDAIAEKFMAKLASEFLEENNMIGETLNFNQQLLAKFFQDFNDLLNYIILHDPPLSFEP